MNITSGTALTNSSNAVLGGAVGGIGIVTMSGGSSWSETTAGADLIVANNGAGSLTLTSLASMIVNDDLFVAQQVNSLGEIAISGFGTRMSAGDSANIGQRGQAVVTISDGGRLLTAANIVADEAASDARVTVQDQFSLWRASSTMTIADAGRALLQVLGGGRVENTSAVIANSVGATGTAEVVGRGSIWQNALGLIVGEFGNGTLIVGDGGRVTVGTGANIFTIGRQVGSTGHVEVRGVDSLLSAATTEVGDSGDGTLSILGGGRVVTGTAVIGDNSSARGEVLVDGVGSMWEVTGEINVSDPGEARLTISNGGLARSSSLTRVAGSGRLTLDDGRLEIGGTTGLLNTGVVEGNGTIESTKVDNNAGGRLRPQGAEPLVLTGTLNNAGLVDVQSGILEVRGPTNNNLNIDARDGATLRFRGTGLDNNSGAQLAITTGVVDVFGPVDNNVGAEIAVGGTAVGVFHNAITNNGTIFVQPGGEIFMLEDLGFGAGSSLSVQLREIDLTQPNAQLSDAFGQVQVAGSAALAGALEVELAGGYAPTAGDSFQILTATEGLSNVFSNEILPALSAGLDWSVQYNANSVVIRVTPALSGDYDIDGDVDGSDFLLWQRALGSTADLEADGNLNGIVDGPDLTVWQDNFGAMAGQAAANGAVPEAGSMVLAGLGALGVAACRQRRSRPSINSLA